MSRGRITSLDELPHSASSRRLNAHLLGDVPEVPRAIKQNLEAEPAKPRLRQKKADRLNKTEAAFLEVLKSTYPHCHVQAQSITLLLANGVRYTPDFTVAFWHGGQIQDLRAYEVKGHMRDDAAVKLKVAAAAYPWIQFTLVWRNGRASAWQFQNINP